MILKGAEKFFDTLFSKIHVVIFFLKKRGYFFDYQKLNANPTPVTFPLKSNLVSAAFATFFDVIDL